MRTLWQATPTYQHITDRGDCDWAPTGRSRRIAGEVPRARCCCVPAALNFLLPKAVPGLDACISSSAAFGTPSLCLPSKPLLILQSSAWCLSFQRPSLLLLGMVICPGLGLPTYSRCAPLLNHILTLHSNRFCECLCILLHRARAACIVRSHGVPLGTKARQSQAPRGR